MLQTEGLLCRCPAPGHPQEVLLSAGLVLSLLAPSVWDPSHQFPWEVAHGGAKWCTRLSQKLRVGTGIQCCYLGWGKTNMGSSRAQHVRPRLSTWIPAMETCCPAWITEDYRAQKESSTVAKAGVYDSWPELGSLSCHSGQKGLQMGAWL